MFTLFFMLSVLNEQLVLNMKLIRFCCKFSFVCLLWWVGVITLLRLKLLVSCECSVYLWDDDTLSGVTLMIII